MKQGIKTSLFNSLVSLKALKKKGCKVGKLKFKSVINSIPLKQYNGTYFIKNNKIRIQGSKKWLRVKGLEQIQETEIANAVLQIKVKLICLMIELFTELTLKQKK